MIYHWILFIMVSVYTCPYLVCFAWILLLECWHPSLLPKMYTFGLCFKTQDPSLMIIQYYKYVGGVGEGGCVSDIHYIVGTLVGILTSSGSKFHIQSFTTHDITSHICFNVIQIVAPRSNAMQNSICFSFFFFQKNYCFYLVIVFFWLVGWLCFFLVIFFSLWKCFLSVIVFVDQLSAEGNNRILYTEDHPLSQLLLY